MALNLQNTNLQISAGQLRQFPGDPIPQIAFSGRSNVGKSSLINSLCQNNKLARTSSEPGKTRMINMYKVNEEFVLADLPGYGFAKAPGSEKAKWAHMMESYLEGSSDLKHVFLLADIRHDPTNEDKMMANYLRHYNIPFSVIATKADKLSKAQRSRTLPVICRALTVQPWQVIAYSSEDGTGRDKLIDLIDSILHPVVEDDGFEIPEGITFEDGPTREEEE